VLLLSSLLSLLLLSPLSLLLLLMRRRSGAKPARSGAKISAGKAWAGLEASVQEARS